MKRLLAILLGLSLALTASAESEEGSVVREIAYTTETGESGYLYASDDVLNHPEAKVPAVLMMMCTGGDARENARACGWVDKAAEERILVIAPEYNNYATYSELDGIVAQVRYVTANYPVDTTRVYATGFSNGGAVSVALASDYPELFAAISAYGWMVDMRGAKDGFDIPFQVIQGTNEYTLATSGGAMAVMEDEQRAIRSLLLFNEMIDASTQANYDETPYWGYVPGNVETDAPDGRTWTTSSYFKAGYSSPFAQLVLIDSATHQPNRHEATAAWSFFRHFSRAADGQIAEIADENEQALRDEEQVIALYRKMCDAMVNKDVDYLRSVMGDTVYHITGATQTLDDWLSDVENEDMRYFAIDIVAPVVTIDGDTATLTCTTSLDARVYGAWGVWNLPHESHYVKVDGVWQSDYAASSEQ